MITKITIIGGGAWGISLAQTLSDNKYEILIYDNNKEYIDQINNRKHSLFDIVLSENIKATNDLKKALFFSDFIFLCIPTQHMRELFNKINKILNISKNFINLSKGIEYISNKVISQIIKEEIDADKIKNYACLYGPSHAEEVILRKITFLTAASSNFEFACQLSKMISNSKYLKVTPSNDVLGCEICVAFKNALSLISGLLDGDDFASNARAAFITLGASEMKKILSLFSSFTNDTILSFVGIGDLIVTAFNKNSRNYQAGQKIKQGMTIDEIYNQAKQIIEGVYNLKVFYHLSVKNKLKLPIIESAYKVIFEKKPINYVLRVIL